MMFYERRDKIVFILLRYVIYAILDKFICLYYLCFLRDKSSKHDKSFEKQGLIIFSGMGIPDILMDLVSCHGFAKNQ